MLLLRAGLFTLLLPGTVTLLVPYLVLTANRPALPWPDGLPAWLGVLPFAAGAGILLRCVRDFAARGRGTLAPVDPPTRLVVSGLYRHVRNPMYLSVVLTLAGEAWLFGSRALLLYAGGFLAAAHLFVVGWEEPSLRRRFGEDWRRYAASVPRWVPRR